MCMFSLALACSANSPNSPVYDLVPVNQAADLTKKEEYGHLQLQPLAMTMNLWGSAVCIIQPAVYKQRCIVGSNTTAVPSHALVEYREDVSYNYNMSKGTNDASTEPVVVRMGPSCSPVSPSCSTHLPYHAHMFDLARSRMLHSLAISCLCMLSLTPLCYNV
jgi:hypothetical protein